MVKKDYAKLRDEESERTRAELWIIIAIVVVVIAGALVFRVVKHKPTTPASHGVPTAPARPLGDAASVRAPAAPGGGPAAP